MERTWHETETTTKKTELSIFFLGMWSHPTYEKCRQELDEYIQNFMKFLTQYCKKRYDLEVEAGSYWPIYAPKTYDDLRQWDRTDWRQAHFGSHLQLYVTYGIDLRPHEAEYPGWDGAGYCEVVPGLKRPDDMMFVEMGEYHGTSLMLPSIYRYYGAFSRNATHELDHMILGRQAHPAWLQGVHRAATMADDVWQMGFTDSKGNDVYFISQKDPRTV